MTSHDLPLPTPPSPCVEFDDRRSAVGRLVELAGTVTDARITYVWLRDEHGRGVCGSARPEAKLRMHSRRVVDSGRPVVVHDGYAATGFGPGDRDHVVAFVGVPIARPDGPVHGALCVVDRRPRMWTTHEVETLETLARAIAAEIELR